MKILFVVYDNDAYVSVFPLGMAYLAAACRAAGHEVEIYSQDVYHFPDEDLTEFLNRRSFDFVGIGACGGYYQYRKMLSLCRAVLNARRPPFLALGGHLVSADPEYFLAKTGCGAICIGEGEVTVVELLAALEGGRPLSGVKGIAFIDGPEIRRTEPRPLIEDVDAIAWPAYDLFPMDHYALMRMPNIGRADRCLPVLTGRGCPFTCNFCYRLDPGFRPRSPEAIIEEMRHLAAEYHITYFAFIDELLMSSVNRTLELCRAFRDSGLSFRWQCSGRLNYAEPEVLQAMKESGCVFINYGIESVDDEALRRMNKALTTAQIVRGVENTLRAGISPGLNIIFGNIGEDAECLRKDVEFLLKYDDHSQLRTIRPVTPYPGSPLYHYAIERGLLRDCEDFYENKHRNSDLLCVNFTSMTDEEFHQALFQANTTLMDNYVDHWRRGNAETLSRLYLDQWDGFRGFRHT